MFNTKSKIRLAAFIAFWITRIRLLFGLPTVFNCKRMDINWNIDLNEGIDFSIFLLGGFEPLTLKQYYKIIRPSSVILDIGANIGSHTLHFAKIAGEKGCVFPFEPTDSAFDRLKTNISLNPTLAPHIHPQQMMLVEDSNFKLPQSIPSSWPLFDNRTNLHPIHEGKYTSLKNATAMTLDYWVKTNAITRIDFIKIDVDGNELGVLLGGMETINLFRPAVLIELARQNSDSEESSLLMLIKTLEELNYSARSINGRHVQLDESLLDIIPYGGSVNLFLYHSPNYSS